MDARSVSAQLGSWARCEDLHPKRRSASTPTRFTRGPGGRAPHTPHSPGRERRPKAAAETLDPGPHGPPKPQLPGTPCRAPRESLERSRRAPTMLFYGRKSPLSVGPGGGEDGLYHGRRALSCPRVAGGENCPAGGCGAGFLERGRAHAVPLLSWDRF